MNAGSEQIMEASAHSTPEHVVSSGVYVAVWVALVILTGLTVGASHLRLGGFATPVTLLIASAKAALVLLFFMHLKYRQPVFRWMFLVTLISYLVFVFLTYADYLTR